MTDRAPCAYHDVFDGLIKKIEVKTEMIPTIMSTLDSLMKIMQGNGRGTLTERIAVLELEVKNMNDADLEVRIQRLEDQFKQFIESMSKLNLEETVSDVRSLTKFYNTTKKFIFGISIPLIVTAVVGIIGLFLNVWVFMQG